MVKKIIFLLCVVSIIVACSSSDDSNSDNSDNFDRTALLSNYADDIIVPAIVNFQTKVADMDVARSNFVNDINQNNLDLLSEAWLEAYGAWQYVAMYNIGIAETFTANENGFRVYFNVYPVTTNLIESAASGTDYNLNAETYFAAQGFPALDFLIHGIADSDTTPLDKFTTNVNFDGYIDYLTNVQSQINNRSNTILNDWQNTFRDEFVANTSSSVTGSFSKIVNDYINYYERALRANKIGTPAGNFSAGQTFPDKVEAYYKNDVSKELALLGLDAVQKFFNGQSFDNSSTSSESFASYLDYLENSELKNDINAQFEAARQQIQSLNDSFSQQVIDDNTQMTEAYDALQAAVVLLKVDMASIFDVQIDFQDNDGD
ncbi:imelysin family protein [Winogradskyella luteola]|uniref:Imelysin family protein n=1 Tax=Winogradskyella luteola TaxID=2828330 RepID=A0A9X1JM11_9FLAO|nr:imelysin family protein [Winogradskyella luteola]MBV7267776.1 imelysin family protein [Winogradskyella luteola]